MDRFRSLIDPDELQELVVEAGLSDEEPTGLSRSDEAVRFTYTGMHDAVREPFVTGPGDVRPVEVPPLPPRAAAIEGDVAGAVRQIAEWARMASGADRVAVVDRDGRAFTESIPAAPIAAGMVRLASVWQDAPSGAATLSVGTEPIHVAWSASPVGTILVVLCGPRPTSVTTRAIADRLRQAFTREVTP